MRRRIGIILIVSIMCLATSFSAFAEGMSVTRSDGKTEAIFLYCYDDDSYAINEWKQVNDKWFYFDGEGLSKQNTWAEIDGKWYYFDQWSVMLHDTTTPDGYQVGSDGAMIVDTVAPPQTQPAQAETPVAVENDTSAKSTTKPQTWSSKYSFVDGMSDNAADCKYVVNTNTGKVHKPNCSSVKDMVAGNTQYYSGDFSALTSGGYSSCGRCRAN